MINDILKDIDTLHEYLHQIKDCNFNDADAFQCHLDLCAVLTLTNVIHNDIKSLVSFSKEELKEVKRKE